MPPDKAQALPEPFASALAESLASLERDDEVEAVFLGGSLAAGDPAPCSDIDLVVIKSVDVEVMERYARYVHGVQVQVISGPPLQFDVWLERDRPQGTVLRQLADGWLLFDRHGLGAEYMQRARDAIAAGLAPMSQPQIRSRRFLLTEALDDVRDCACNPAQARWLMNIELVFAVETAFLWHQQWTPKAKRALAEIHALDKDLGALCDQYFDATELCYQQAAFEALVAHVLAPLSGELREEWTRPPEPVVRNEGSG
ncbi:MAG: nucleotidyltransferase domain-containing protein [Anaerolineae bacterium]|nr:nucleotidyltransferase domain-containing protein [Anaerolineae bacterium]